MTSNTRVLAVFVATTAIGGAIGFFFGENEKLKFYKLLNVFGLIYDFLAVLLLSYVILARDSIKEVVAHYVSLVFVVFTVMFPASFHIALSFSNKTIELDRCMKVFLFISFAPMLYVYGSPVLEPLSYKSYSPVFSIKILGTLLLLLGFCFQICAAVEDISN